MTGCRWRHGRLAALAAAGTPLVIGAVLGLAAGCGAAPGSPAAQPGAVQRTPTQQRTLPQATVQQTQGPQSSAPPRTAPASVPWTSVGPGWLLDTYSAGTKARPAPTTLYLVSPAGTRYPLVTWPVSATPAPVLKAWAGDKTEALVTLTSPTGTPDGYGELNLRNGAMTRVAFASSATSATGFTQPDGQQILGVTQRGQDVTIARYTPAGTVVKDLVTVPGDVFGGVSYAPDGSRLAVPALDGLVLVSNAGGVLGKLPVPGAAATSTCDPVRWWNAATVLASCGGRLWLVPASGARPSALTPARAAASFDLGDIGAWPLPAGLYLQSLGACGTLELNRQAANGSITRVPVPGMTDSPVVVTAAGARLLIEQQGCAGSGGQLAWFDPATGAEQWLFTAGAGAAVAYNSPQNAAFF